MASTPSDHAHYPHLNSADIIGLVGLAALAFVVGRATAPNNSDCPGRLDDTRQELLLLYARERAGAGIIGQGVAPGLL